jgi:hypothetical protein
MRTFALMGLTFSTLFLTACGGFERLPPGTDYGPPPRPELYRSAVEAKISENLIDPESARFRFGTPIRGYINQGLVHGGRIAAIGHIIPVEVNARNRMGGYVGFVPFWCAYSAGLVVTCERGNYQNNPLVTIEP